MYSLAIYSKSIIKIYKLYARGYSRYTIVVFAKIESKKALFCLCVREEIHSQGRSSRWEKMHTGLCFGMQKKNCILVRFRVHFQSSFFAQVLFDYNI